MSNEITYSKLPLNITFSNNKGKIKVVIHNVVNNAKYKNTFWEHTIYHDIKFNASTNAILNYIRIHLKEENIKVDIDSNVCTIVCQLNDRFTFTFRCLLKLPKLELDPTIKVRHCKYVYSKKRPASCRCGRCGGTTHAVYIDTGECTCYSPHN